MFRLAVAVVLSGTLAGCAVDSRVGAPAEEAAPPAPEILVEGPASVASAVEGVRRLDPGRWRALTSRLGIEEPGPPIRVLVLPEDSTAAAEAPVWVAGWADGDANLVVLFPERSRSYPDATFESLVVHEVAHVLIHRAAAGRPVPRWFHEGLATALGEWGIDDRARLTLAMLFGGDRSLDDLERAFASGDARRIGRAYALSAAFVREVQMRHGADAAARILAARAAGRPFGRAFADATGTSLSAAERAFWNRDRRWLRWVRLLADSAVLWTGIAALALWALWRRRRRAAEIRRRWEEEERAAQGASHADEDRL